MSKLYQLITSIIQINLNLGVVCTLDELVDRLKADIDLNGRLNCKRDQNLLEQEDVNERSRLVKAQWKGDCAFESDGAKWVDTFLTFYSTSRKLVDAEGASYSANRPHEADMCEVVRSMIGNDLFEGAFIDLNLSIDPSILMLLKCPNGKTGSTRVCAATGGAQDEKAHWFIFLSPKGINASQKVNHKCVNQGYLDLITKVNAKPVAGQPAKKKFQ